MEKEIKEIVEETAEEIKEDNKNDVEDLFSDEEQPIVLNLDKKALKGEPRLKAEGEFVDFSGYVKSFKSNISNLIALLGAVLVYLAPYMTWLKQTKAGDTFKADLLDLAGEFSDIALNQKSIMFFGIVILVMAVCMLALSAREYIRPLRPYADNYIIRIVPSIIAVLMFVLVLKNKMYVAEVAKSITETGLGQIFLTSGIVLYTISVVFDFMNRGNEYE